MGTIALQTENLVIIAFLAISGRFFARYGGQSSYTDQAEIWHGGMYQFSVEVDEV